MKTNILLYKNNVQQIIEETNINIGLDGKFIYNDVKRVIERDKIKLEYGKSFVLELPINIDSFDQINIHFKERGNIKERIKDCRFMLDLIKTKKIQINNDEIRINKFDKEEIFLRKHLTISNF